MERGLSFPTMKEDTVNAVGTCEKLECKIAAPINIILTEIIEKRALRELPDSDM
jgi:hypothetical protein